MSFQWCDFQFSFKTLETTIQFKIFGFTIARALMHTFVFSFTSIYAPLSYAPLVTFPKWVNKQLCCMWIRYLLIGANSSYSFQLEIPTKMKNISTITKGNFLQKKLIIATVLIRRNQCRDMKTHLDVLCADCRDGISIN